MTIRKAIATIICCAGLFAGIGAGAGFLLGRFNPQYYRGIIRVLRDADFNPVSFGVGQGFTQGLAGGALVGVALVAIFCWREIRLQRGTSESTQTVATSPHTRRLFWIAAAILCGVLFLAVGTIAGLLIGESGAYHRRFLEERNLLQSGLSGNPALDQVKIVERSDGGIHLVGKVSTQADLENLRNIAVRALGESRGREVIGGVGVRPQP
jgi:hypothetical protein